MPRAALVVNNVVRLTVFQRLDSEPGTLIENVFHYIVKAAGTGNGYVPLANAFETSVIVAGWGLAVITQLRFIGMEIARVIPEQAEAAYDYLMTATGERADLVPLPAVNVAIVTRNTLQMGPRGNGRNYISGLATEDVDGAVLVPATLSLLDDFAQLLAADIVSAGWTFGPVVVTKSGTPPVLVGAFAVEEAGVNAYTTSLITRRPNRGV